MKLKSALKFGRALLIFLALISVGFSVGYTLSQKGYKIGNFSEPKEALISRENPAGNSVNFTMFWQVWDLLKAQYYDPEKLVESNLVYGAIKGMVAAIGDPYTVFLSKDEQKVTEEDLSGSFEGIGIQIGYKGAQLAVIAPLPGSPAEKTGILAGDLIIGVKDDNKNVDKSTDGMSLPEAVKLIRGPKGSKVTLALIREGVKTPLFVDVERQSIDVPSVVLSFAGAREDVAHLKITRFGAETKKEWDGAVLEILGKKNLKGIVLDVRNNPGGYLQAAVDVATDFFPKGTLVVSEESGGDIKESLSTEEQGRLVNSKVVVLINKGSASASEILAGALRDQKKVKLVGVTSFGKGTVQEPREFPDGTGIHITIRKWLTPSGTWVHDKGLTPDVEIKLDSEDKVDTQLNKAIDLL